MLPVMYNESLKEVGKEKASCFAFFHALESLCFLSPSADWVVRVSSFLCLKRLRLSVPKYLHPCMARVYYGGRPGSVDRDLARDSENRGVSPSSPTSLFWEVGQIAQFTLSLNSSSEENQANRTLPPRGAGGGL